MSSRKRIQRKDPWQPTPDHDILKTRGFSNGVKARESRLPSTNDMLQTRPFANPVQESSQPEDTRSFEEKMEGAEFRYNGAKISTFAPSTPSDNSVLSPFSLLKADGEGQQETIQREEVSGGEKEKAEVGTIEEQVQASSDEGTIQRLCDECEGELAGKEEKQPIQAKLTVGEAGDKYEQKAAPQQSMQRATTSVQKAPTHTIQRALSISVNQYKTNSGSRGSGPRNRVKAVDRALDDYHQNVPKDRLGIKATTLMALNELQATRQLLDNLMVQIDTYLAYNNIAQKRRQGTYALRVAVQDERMKITQALARKGEFSTDGLDDELSETLKEKPSSFINWLEHHPGYLEWAGQGAGACITSAEAMAEFLGGIFKDVKVIGILAFAASDVTKVANHFVVVVKIGGEDIVVDPTQIQFLGGNPQIATETTWRQRLRTVKIAFSGSDYEPAQAIKIKDFGSTAEALKFAGEKRRARVQLGDVAGEADL